MLYQSLADLKVKFASKKCGKKGGISLPKLAVLSSKCLIGIKTS